MTDVQILATLWPTMSHYAQFAKDPRLAGIRLNTAMTDPMELPGLLDKALNLAGSKPVYFDVKGRQLRVTYVDPRTDRLEIRLNHPVYVKTPTPVLFKAGADGAYLKRIEDDGYKLVFHGGPNYTLLKGESLHIRDPSFRNLGKLFTEEQLQYLDIAKNAGVSRYMLSYADNTSDIDEFRTIVGDAGITAKIENLRGIGWVKDGYVKTPNLGLLCARGDLFVEVDRPHEISNATKDIIKADPDAILGSRLLLSVTNEAVPSCSDLSEVEWLLDKGYRRFMFCDGLCLKGEPLDRAINVLRAVAADHRLETVGQQYNPIQRLMRSVGLYSGK